MAKAPLPNPRHAPTTDFDLHGIAGVRVVDARPADVAVVARQLGPLPRRLARDPDIVIRFVDRLETGSRLRYLGARELGWTDEGFYVLKSRKEPAMVRIPMDRIGGPCELVCERGLSAVPFLIAILNLTVLVNGALPLHAGAFELDGRGVLVTGWSKGGKTELLMAAARAGARYIGDEWVYLTPDGRMHGIPEPVRLWDWHLEQLPDVRRSLGASDRLRLKAIRTLGRIERALPGVVRRSPPGRLLHRRCRYSRASSTSTCRRTACSAISARCPGGSITSCSSWRPPAPASPWSRSRPRRSPAGWSSRCSTSGSTWRRSTSRPGSPSPTWSIRISRASRRSSASGS